ncbi:hypothetical protein EYF80_054947 [Liparis tanakae]|uniref:Uncharacterized protein n=1 Tax=Liparis tanakae TaxID=230148 RepID=A0A4Z2F104_9TELE|nr:hypothetical protein EYF80_054947 [Liparis tanakae]
MAEMLLQRRCSIHAFPLRLVGSPPPHEAGVAVRMLTVPVSTVSIPHVRPAFDLQKDRKEEKASERSVNTWWTDMFTGQHSARHHHHSFTGEIQSGMLMYSYRYDVRGLEVLSCPMCSSHVITLCFVPRLLILSPPAAGGPLMSRYRWQLINVNIQ